MSKPKEKSIFSFFQSAKKTNLKEEEIKKILKNFLSEKKIHNVAIPKAKMNCLDENNLLKDIIKFIIKTGHSRFPVLNKKQEVVGVLFVKDIFSYVSKLATKKVKSLMKPVIKISFAASTQSALQEMKDKKSHMALVVDEYGSIDGIVTMEDIVEELVGNIEDEFDKAKPEYKKQGKKIVINSDMPLEEFNTVFNFSLQEERVDTIGGYVCFLEERIPTKGEFVFVEGRKIEIISATKKKLKKLILYI